MDLDSLYVGQETILGGNRSAALVTLQSAHDLILDRGRYITHAMSLNAEGKPVKPQDPTAVAWNMEGALARHCNEWGIIPPSILQHVDYCVPLYSVYVQLPMSPDHFATFGDFGEYYHHEHALGLLNYARELLVQGKSRL